MTIGNIILVIVLGLFVFGIIKSIIANKRTTPKKATHHSSPIGVDSGSLYYFSSDQDDNQASHFDNLGDGSSSDSDGGGDGGGGE